MLPLHLSIVVRPLRAAPLAFLPRATRRYKRYEAHEAHLDQDALADARSWFDKFDASQLPKGNTTFARSSGPGGQHVNK
jgi:peptidyl-tRNA hydrolase ICT1